VWNGDEAVSLCPITKVCAAEVIRLIAIITVATCFSGPNSALFLRLFASPLPLSLVGGVA